MSIKTRKKWLAAGLTVLLASGAPGFVAPSMMTSAYAQTQKITGTVVEEFGDPIIGAKYHLGSADKCPDTIIILCVKSVKYCVKCRKRFIQYGYNSYFCSDG